MGDWSSAKGFLKINLKLHFALLLSKFKIVTKNTKAFITLNFNLRVL